MAEKKIKIMISSSIYGFEDNVRQVASYLETMGYEVISSLLGTVKVHPGKSNLDNSLLAVEECDVFLGFIRTNCGTGQIGEKNITFEEIKYAIALDKPYWFMAEHDVVFGRRMLTQGLSAREIGKALWDVIVVNRKVFDPLCIDMYNTVIKIDEQDIPARIGNWVQPFHCLDDIRRFVEKQFSDVDYIRTIVESKAM
ncbi:MAG: DUF4062 domain-containing protein [Bacteroidales bacterium]|nr:DUF4062 domain-containing protein [Bacteroidales bacterium]